jgi:hypothetical protein
MPYGDKAVRLGFALLANGAVSAHRQVSGSWLNHTVAERAARDRREGVVILR